MPIFYKFINSLFFATIFCFNLSSSNLECRTFKAGQANFILLTKDSSALVVDCGVGSGYGSSQDLGVFKIDNEYYKEIEGALQNVKKLKIVITHNHVDHYGSKSNLQTFVERINKGRKRIL